jgi:hypothetical protein
MLLLAFCNSREGRASKRGHPAGSETPIWRRRWQVPATCAAEAGQELQIESGTSVIVGKGYIVLGLMMDVPLLLAGIRAHGEAEVVSRAALAP